MSQDGPGVNLPPRHRRPKRKDVRDRLVEGAMRAFAIRGFAGASIDFICAQAGFSRGAFYSNFKDKDALFFALYDQRITRLTQRLGTIAETAKSADDPLAAVREMLRLPDPDELRWDILNKEFILYALRNEPARARLRAARADTRARLSEILTTVNPALSDQPAHLDQLSRLIIALHEGELTQLGLDPQLAEAPSLMSLYLPELIMRPPRR